MRTDAGHGLLSAAGGYAGTAPRVRRPGAVRRGPAAAAPPARTPWSFQLLLAFLLLLYSNAAILLPRLEALAPAQTIGFAALAVLFVERSLSRRPALVMVAPESHLLLAFLAAAALSSFTALWMRHAVEQTLLLLKFVAVYLLIVNTVESWRRLRVVFGVMVLGGLFPALGTLRNAWQGEFVENNRAAWIGIFANPNDLAYALAVLFPLAAALAIGARGWRKAALWAAPGVFGLAIFASYSRGGLLAFGVVLLLAFWRWSPPRFRLPGVLLVAVAVPMVVATYWAREEGGFGDLLADATLQQRLDTIGAGLAMFADQPLTGIGLGCSVIGWPLYAPPEATSQGWLHSHNTIVQLLSETGLAGTLTFALLLATALVKLRRRARAWSRTGQIQAARMASAVEIALWGFLAAGLSGGHVLSWFPYLLLGLGSAIRRLPDPAAAGAVPMVRTAAGAAAGGGR